jgi:mRNA-degrading endonuclease RelE of RelBE toxin-antitoxin system
MPQQLRFEIIFDRAVSAHFASIDRKDRTLILDAIEEQLGLEPTAPTRNRKALRIPNMLNASWELRCGANNRYRVFYDVDVDARIVVVLAIGRKIRSSLWIGNEEFLL